MNLIECKERAVKKNTANGLHSYMVLGHKGEIVVEFTQSPASESVIGGPRVQGWA